MFNAGRFWTDGPMVVTGCTKVSEGCMNCWSEQAHIRRCKNPNLAHAWPPECLTDGRFNGKVVFNLDALKNACKGRAGKVISPWNDLYHPDVTIKQIEQAFDVMDNADQHFYTIITKRIDRAANIWARWGNRNPGKNKMHFATMENQARVDERIPHLLRIPGKRGIIIEPCLGDMNLTNCREGRCNMFRTCMGHRDPCDVRYQDLRRIHQVILGPENATGRVKCKRCNGKGTVKAWPDAEPISGLGMKFCEDCKGHGDIPKARPMDEAWAQGVEEQCKAAGVPFYRKDKVLPEGVERGKLAWRV